jgi:hypothetical protein
MKDVIHYLPKRLVRYARLPYWGILPYTLIGLVLVGYSFFNYQEPKTKIPKSAQAETQNIPTTPVSSQLIYSVSQKENGKYVLVKGNNGFYATDGEVKFERSSDGVERIKLYINGKPAQIIKIKTDSFNIYSGKGFRVAKGSIKKGLKIFMGADPEYNIGYLTQKKDEPITNLRQASIEKLDINIDYIKLLLQDEQLGKINWLTTDEKDQDAD